MEQFTTLSARLIAKKINIPTKEWEGNCHGISMLITELGIVKGRVERGHWLGKVNKGSIFFNKPLIPHSWIRAESGEIIDPTRWCFECKDPYIFVSKKNQDEECYDAGGNKLRESFKSPAPKFNPEDKKLNITLEQSCDKFVMDLLNNPPFITVKMGFWLSNLPLKSLGEHAKAVYTSLEKSGHEAFIPVDNYDIVMSK